MSGFMKLQVWPELAVEARLDVDCNEVMPQSVADANSYPYTVVGKRWFAQYSAPGYMDQTGHVMADTAEEAIDECLALYGEDEEGSDDVAEAEQLKRTLAALRAGNL